MAYGREKMNEIRERVEKVRQIKGLSKNAMAKALGFKQGGSFCVQTVKDSRLNISPGTLYRITKEFGVNEKWLIDGVGDMFSAPPAEEIMQSFDSAFNINGNNSSNVTQNVNTDYKSLEGMNKLLMSQVKEKDEEIARLNKRLDKLIDMLNKQ